MLYSFGKFFHLGKLSFQNINKYQYARVSHCSIRDTCTFLKVGRSREIKVQYNTECIEELSVLQ